MAATELLASALAPRQSRDLVTDELAPAGWPPDVMAVAELLVSELATNAVVHAVTERLVVIIDLVDDVLVVQVADDDARLPELRTPAQGEESGRGLPLIALLADDWGFVAHERGCGKAVWFRICCSRRAT